MRVLHLGAIGRCLRRLVVTTPGLLLAFATACNPQPPTTAADSEAMREAYAAYGVSVSRRAGDLLYIGGLVAFEDDGSVLAPGDGERQIVTIYARLDQILSMYGATLKNVVRENTFVTDWEEFAKGAPIRIAAYDAAGAEYPAATAVQVVSLAAEGLIAEVDVIAYLGD